jgi:lysophospholipase
LGTRIAPGQTTASYVERVILPENELTTDSEMFAYMQDQLAAYPDLGLGGPSLRWLNEALVEMRKLSRMRSPAFPCVTFLGTDETIVDVDRIRDRMARWPNGRLEVIESAPHEVMMETPAIRNQVFDQICAHFDAHR